MASNIHTDTPHADIPIACTLSNKAAASQALEWVDLQSRATSVTALEAGVRMTLPATMAEAVDDLARRESTCCAFLTIDTSVVDEVLTLDISSANADALPVIDALAGIERP